MVFSLFFQLTELHFADGKFVYLSIGNYLAENQVTFFFSLLFKLKFMQKSTLNDCSAWNNGKNEYSFEF